MPGLEPARKSQSPWMISHAHLLSYFPPLTFLLEAHPAKTLITYVPLAHSLIHFIPLPSRALLTSCCVNIDASLRFTVLLGARQGLRSSLHPVIICGHCLNLKLRRSLSLKQGETISQQFHSLAYYALLRYFILHSRTISHQHQEGVTLLKPTLYRARRIFRFRIKQQATCH